MATKNLLVFKAQFYSINTWFLNELLYKNMIWLLGSLRFFLCSFVLCSFRSILNFISRFQEEGEGKTESGSEIDGFREDLTKFLFQCCDDVFEDFEKSEGETQTSSFMEAISDVHEDGKKSEGDAMSPVLMEFYSEFHEDGKKEGETESSVSMEVYSEYHEDEGKKGLTDSSISKEYHFDYPEDENKSDGETECSVSMGVRSESDENKEEQGETESSASMEVHSDCHKVEGKEGEIENSVSKEVDSDYSEDGNKSAGKTEYSVLLEVYSDSQENINEVRETKSSASIEVHSDLHENEKQEGEIKNSVLLKVQSYLTEEEEKGNEETECSILTEANSDSHEEGNENEKEKGCVLMEVDSTATTQKYQYVSGRNISGFMDEPIAMKFTFREFFVGPNVPVISDNNVFFNSEIIAQKKESSEHLEEEEVESAQKEFRGCNNSWEILDSEIFKASKEKRDEESGKSEKKDEKERPNQEEIYREKTEEWEKVMEELEYDEENEGEFEWEHDNIVEQLKMELKNARQGGLSTILEEEEEEEQEGQETEETECPKGVEDQKLQKNEEFKDQMDEIEEVYQIYEEKMRKLDILNYQTMHALGLLQLKDPVKSSFPGAKPPWPRKEAKTPLMKFIEELRRDLELVYVGQVCLSWEMLCWQHKKAHQLKQYHSQAEPPQYNLAAAEFQLFQVLLQRFIENEAFQGPRTHNFVKNRCVIRNLLQVPPIRDDSVKEKNIVKGDEEYVVSIARLAEIIKESMWLFWKFVRADKEDGNLILRVSQQTRTDSKDPAISDLVKDIRAHLHKKEKKLKDMVRSGNCIVRKFQKQQQHHEDQLNHEQLLAQVELKLVSRVLHLSKLRKDHLIWCNEKLRRIKFVKKKILVEPSFLLFPC